jgi:tetratricopeptide (TPR) repeat protein
VKTCHVFLSHRHIDRGLADVLRSWLEALPGASCTVFQSSDPEVLPAGADWRKQVEDNVRASDLVIALFGKTGGEAKWDHINWECSESLALGKPVIPLCHSGIEATDLHDRLRPFVALRLEGAGFGNDFVNSLVSRVPGLDVTAVDVDFLERALRQALQLLPIETLNLSLPRMDLAGYRGLKQGFPPSILLHPHFALVDFAGRSTELDELNAFASDEAPFLWKVLCGEAGTGKTRLGMEFCRSIRDEGWNAGFLDEDELAAFVNSGRCDGWKPNRPTCIAVDYAASKVELLRHLLRYAADLGDRARRQGDAVPLRVLLLERHADWDQGWLHELVSKAATRQVLKLAWHPSLVLGRPPHMGDEGQAGYVRRILECASQAWGRVADKPVPPLRELTDLELRLLQTHTLGRPLYLQMAALHACEIGSFDDVFRWDRSQLLRAAVERELAYVERANDPDLHELVLWAAAVLCLTGPSVAYQPSWRGRLRDRIDETGNTRIQPRHVNDALTTIFDVTGSSRRRPIEPDLVAEAFVVHVLRHGPSSPTALLSDALDLGGAESWRSILRLVQDLHGLPAHEDIDSWLEPLVRDRPREELTQLAKFLPERTVSLRHLAIELYRELLDGDGSSGGSREDALERARWQSKLALHLDRANRHQRAVVEARQAVSAWERLSGEHVTASDGRAYALYVLGNCLDSAEEQQESLDVSRMAVDLRRRLLPGYRAELAKCLNNLGLRLRSGDPGGARRALDEAVDLWRSLTRTDPSEHAPELARSLNNLASLLHGLGEPAAALEAIQESTRIREEFAARDPDTNGADLLFSLFTHVKILTERGRVEEAREIVHRYETVARELGSRDGYLLVRELATLARLLEWTNDHERALRAACDRVDLAGALDSRDASTPRLDLGKALLSRGELLGRMNEPDKALRDVSKAIETLEGSEARDPVSVQPILAKCWLAMMNLRSSEPDGWREAAMKVIDVGKSLSTLVSEFFRADRGDEAVMVAREAVAVMEQLATRASGEVITAQLALACNNRAYVLHRLGRNEEGLAAARRSCELLRALIGDVTKRDGRTSPDVAERSGESHETLAAILLARGETALARAAIELSIGFYDQLVEQASTDRLRIRRAECMLTSAEIAAAMNDKSVAGPTFKKAIEAMSQSTDPPSRESRVRAREVAVRIRDLRGEMDEESIRIAEQVLSMELPRQQ